VHFCPHLCALRKTSWSVTHPKIGTGQSRLNPEFFSVGLLKKRYTLMVWLFYQILLSLGPGCHNPPPSKIDVPVDQPQARNVPSWPRPYVQYWHTRIIHSVSSIRTILYPPRGPMRHVYISTFLTLYATVSFSTDPYTLVKPWEPALIPFVTPRPLWVWRSLLLAAS
jgi:hypothetical protein